jgi:hypothetical protein
LIYIIGLLNRTLSLVGAFEHFSSRIGLSRWCRIESKLFKLVVEGRSPVCRIVERSVCLRKVNFSWLVATVEELVLEEGTKAFWRRSRVGFPALLAQRCSNKHGWFLVVMEYGPGRLRGFILLKGEMVEAGGPTPRSYI